MFDQFSSFISYFFFYLLYSCIFLFICLFWKVLPIQLQISSYNTYYTQHVYTYKLCSCLKEYEIMRDITRFQGHSILMNRTMREIEPYTRQWNQLHTGQWLDFTSYVCRWLNLEFLKKVNWSITSGAGCSLYVAFAILISAVTHSDDIRWNKNSLNLFSIFYNFKFSISLHFHSWNSPMYSPKCS